MAEKGGDGDAEQWDAARQNIRETLKWLIAALAGLAALLLAGSSMTGVGALQLEQRLYIAAAGAFLALVPILCIIAIAVWVLATPSLSIQQLANDNRFAWMRRELDEGYHFIFPAGLTSVQKVGAHFRALFNERFQHLSEVPTDAATAVDRKKRLKELTREKRAIDPVVRFLLNYASLGWLRHRFHRFLWVLFAVTPFTLVGFALFAWGVNPPKPYEYRIEPLELIVSLTSEQRQRLEQKINVPACRLPFDIRVIRLSLAVGRVAEAVTVPEFKCPPARVLLTDNGVALP